MSYHKSCYKPPSGCCFNPPFPKYCTDLSILAEVLFQFEILGISFALYLIVVQNNGPIGATNVTYTINISGQYAGSISLPGNQTLIGNKLVVNLPGLASGDSAFTLLAVLGDEDTNSISASVISDTPECNSANNSASASGISDDEVVTLANPASLESALAGIQLKYPDLDRKELSAFGAQLSELLDSITRASTVDRPQ